MRNRIPIFSPISSGLGASDERAGDPFLTFWSAVQFEAGAAAAGVTLKIIPTNRRNVARMVRVVRERILSNIVQINLNRIGLEPKVYQNGVDD